MDKFSKYLKKKKPLVRKLIEKLAHEYEFVSVLGTDVKGKCPGYDDRKLRYAR